MRTRRRPVVRDCAQIPTWIALPHVSTRGTAWTSTSAEAAAGADSATAPAVQIDTTNRRTRIKPPRSALRTTIEAFDDRRRWRARTRTSGRRRSRRRPPRRDAAVDPEHRMSGRSVRRRGRRLSLDRRPAGPSRPDGERRHPRAVRGPDAGPLTITTTSSPAQRPEARAHLLAEELRLLPGGEVS